MGQIELSQQTKPVAPGACQLPLYVAKPRIIGRLLALVTTWQSRHAIWVLSQASCHYVASNPGDSWIRP